MEWPCVESCYSSVFLSRSPLFMRPDCVVGPFFLFLLLMKKRLMNLALKFSFMMDGSPHGNESSLGQRSPNLDDEMKMDM